MLDRNLVFLIAPYHNGLIILLKYLCLNCKKFKYKIGLLKSSSIDIWVNKWVKTIWVLVLLQYLSCVFSNIYSIYPLDTNNHLSINCETKVSPDIAKYSLVQTKFFFFRTTVVTQDKTRSIL